MREEIAHMNQITKTRVATNKYLYFVVLKMML